MFSMEGAQCTTQDLLLLEFFNATVELVGHRLRGLGECLQRRVGRKTGRISGGGGTREGKSRWCAPREPSLDGRVASQRAKGTGRTTTGTAANQGKGKACVWWSPRQKRLVAAPILREEGGEGADVGLGQRRLQFVRLGSRLCTVRGKRLGGWSTQDRSNPDRE